MTKSYFDLQVDAGFVGDEFATAASIKRKIVTDQPLDTDEIATWQAVSGKWAAFASALEKRDAALAVARQQQDTPQRQADPSGGLGAALADLRAGGGVGRPGVRRTERRTLGGIERLVWLDTGEEVREHHHGSASSGGLARIGAALARDEVVRQPSGARR